MVTILILTHGGLAQELLIAAETIVGSLQNFRIVTLEWTDTFEEASLKTRSALEDLGSGDQVLILTDMYGGTPYNVATSLAEPGRVEVVTGVNLPMVVRLGCPDTKDKTVSELADWIQIKARTSICRSGEGNGSRQTTAEDTGESCDD